MQYNTGHVAVTSGSQTVYGVHEIALTRTDPSPNYPLQVGDTLTFVSSAASAKVISYNVGARTARCYVTTVAQPVLNERVNVSGTVSGTVFGFNERPQFLGNVFAADVFVPQTAPASAGYFVSAIPSNSFFTLAAQFAQASLTDSAYVVSHSFTPYRGYAYAEQSDLQPAEITKRGLLSIDLDMNTALTTITGALSPASLSTASITAQTIAATNSLTVSGVPVATGTNTITAASVTAGTIAATNSLTVSGVPVATGTGSSFSIVASGTTYPTTLTLQAFDGVHLKQPAANTVVISGTPNPGRVHVRETVGRAITSTEANFVQMTAITLKPTPNGVRKYRVNANFEFDEPSANVDVSFRLYKGANGTLSDTLERTFTTSATVYGSYSVAGYEIIPTAAQPKVGLSHQYSGAATGSTIASLCWIEVVEIKE